RRWLGSPGRVAQVMVHLAGQGALDQRLLKGQRCGIDGFGRHRAVTERLQQFWGNGRQRGRLSSWFAWHRHSLASCYASNTKLLTGPLAGAYLFAILPMIHDFVPLVLVIAPSFLLLGLISYRPKLFLPGMVLIANLATLLSIQNHYV